VLKTKPLITSSISWKPIPPQHFSSSVIHLFTHIHLFSQGNKLGGRLDSCSPTSNSLVCPDFFYLPNDKSLSTSQHVPCYNPCLKPVQWLPVTRTMITILTVMVDKAVGIQFLPSLLHPASPKLKSHWPPRCSLRSPFLLPEHLLPDFPGSLLQSNITCSENSLTPVWGKQWVPSLESSNFLQKVSYDLSLHSLSLALFTNSPLHWNESRTIRAFSTFAPSAWVNAWYIVDSQQIVVGWIHIFTLLPKKTFGRIFLVFSAQAGSLSSHHGQQVLWSLWPNDSLSYTPKSPLQDHWSAFHSFAQAPLKLRFLSPIPIFSKPFLIGLPERSS
jgi:hypothetical protein